jgi:hypothetical protein
MSIPKPPFHSSAEELLYGIYQELINPTNVTAISNAINELKGNVPETANTLEKLYNIVQGLNFLTSQDIDTLAEINSILTNANVVDEIILANNIDAIKGNVPVAGDTLGKLYNIIQGLTFLTQEQIDTLAELNAVLTDADLVRTVDLDAAVNSLKGSVPENGNTLGKLYNIIQGLNFLSQDKIDTLAELNAIITDADLVREQDLSQAIAALKGSVPVAGNTLEKLYDLIQSNTTGLNRKSVQFFFAADHEDQHNRDRFVFRGRINSLSEDFTNELSGVAYKTRIDTSSSWINHSDLVALQTWIDNNTTGNGATGTKFWIKCMPEYKSGHDDEAMNVFSYNVL